MASLNIVIFITSGLMAVGAVFAVLSTAGNYWEKISSGSKIIHMGLWQTCGKPFTRSYCVDRSKTDALKVTQAFMIMACVGYLLAFAYCALLFLKKHWTNKALAVLLIMTAVCLVVGLSVYTKEISVEDFTFSWSYIIGWCSAPVALLAGLLSLIDHGAYVSI